MCLHVMTNQNVRLKERNYLIIVVFRLFVCWFCHLFTFCKTFLCCLRRQIYQQICVFYFYTFPALSLSIFSRSISATNYAKYLRQNEWKFSACDDDVVIVIANKKREVSHVSEALDKWDVINTAKYTYMSDLYMYRYGIKQSHLFLANFRLINHLIAVHENT